MLWLVLLFLRYRAAAENVRFGPTLGIYREWSFLNHHITVYSVSVILLNFQTVAVTLSLK